VTARMLRDLGHRVVTARTPGDAIGKFLECANELALIVTDVAMPKMNGAELVERLRRERPTLRALYVSGHSSSATLSQLSDDDGFLQKPFSIDELSRATRAALGSDEK